MAPVVVVVAWALKYGWMPLGDSGQLTVRSRDVFTAHHPFLGAWSSSSQRLGDDVNNLGPLYVEMLAPFTKVSAFGGSAVGAGVIVAACIVSVWVTARRLAGPAGAVVAMAATVALEASMGTQSLLESRQQVALLFPWWLLLWLAVALWCGERWALAPAVFVTSVVVQTHFSFIYQCIVVLAAVALASVPWAWRRHSRPEWGRSVAQAVVVAALCWAQPLWDQWYGTGNLGQVFGLRGGGASPGLADELGPPGVAVGAELVARSSLRHPFWFPGSMGELLDPPVGAGLVKADGGTWLTLGVWVGLLLGVIAVARWRRRGVLGALAGVSVAAIGGGVVAAAQIPAGAFSLYPPQNYYWMWPIGLLASVALLGGIRELLGAWPRTARAVRPAPLAWVGLVGLVALTVPTLRPASSLPYVDREANRGRGPGRALVASAERALDRADIEGPVVVDFSRDLGFTGYRWTLLTVFQARGIEFTFDAGATDLRRFGRERCDGGKATHRLYVESAGGVTDIEPGQMLLGAVEDPNGFDAAFVLAPAGPKSAKRCPRS